MLWNIYYRPQTKLAKVMFLHVSVILSTGGSTWVGTPWPGTPPTRTRYSPPWTRYTPPETRYTPSGPGTPPWTRSTPQDQVHPTEQCMLGDTGQQAGDTHPTGMHSCYLWIYLERVWSNRSITITQTPDPYKSLLRDPSLFNFNDNAQKETRIVGVANYRNQTSKH